MPGAPVYLNEFDRHAAQWLRNLIAARLLPPGEVDGRDIRQIQGVDLDGYDECHFLT